MPGLRHPFFINANAFVPCLWQYTVFFPLLTLIKNLQNVFVLLYYLCYLFKHPAFYQLYLH
jgi:hypothetical protein